MTLRWIAGKLKMGSAESCSPLSAKNEMMKIGENARPHHGDKTHEGRCSFGKPKPMVLLGVQNAEDDDSLAFDAIEQLAGESAQQDTPEITVINRLPFGIRSQHAKGSASRQDKLHAHPSRRSSYHCRAACKSASARRRMMTGRFTRPGA